MKVETLRASSLRVAGRIDAGYFLDGVGALKSVLRATPGLELRPVETFAVAHFPTRFKRTYAVDSEPFVSYLRPYDVFEYLPPEADKLSALRTKNLENYMIREGDILQTCSGRNLGPVTIADSYLAQFALSHDMIRITVPKRKERFYLLAFLRSDTGQTLLRGDRGGSVISHITPDHVNALNIPFIDKIFAEVALLAENGTYLRERARIALHAAVENVDSQYPPEESHKRDGWTTNAANLLNRFDAVFHSETTAANRDSLLAAGGHRLGDVAVISKPGGRYRMRYVEPENGVPQRRWAWLVSTLEDAGHEVLVIAPPPHYLRNVSLKEWFEQKGYRSREEQRGGDPKRIIVRSGYVPGGTSITQKVLNQIAVAAGGMHVVFHRSGTLRDFQPDIVLGTVPAIPTAFVTAISAWRFRVPYVIDLRDAWPELLTVADRWNVSTGKPSLRQRILAKGPLQAAIKATDVWLTRVLRRAAAVISTSSYLAQDLQKRSTGKQRVCTVRNVFPPETLIQKQPRLDGPKDELNVLYAGTLGRAQNLANALEAARAAHEAGVHVRLRLVGAGAAKAELIETAKRLGVDAVFEHRRSAELLQECYEWADTALVHLTDWTPLLNAVPSKTYELMDQGLHISGVVAGETAEIIQTMRAGDVVAPENPHALAELWVGLARNRSRLQVSGTGAGWVRQQREAAAPKTLVECLEWVHTTRQ